MSNVIDRLFRDFDEGRISRRELLRALGLSLLAVPSIGLAQGGGRAGGDSTGGRGRGRGNRAPSDTTHAQAPFEPTGWKTLYLDHISFEVPDFRRSAAFYQALLGWTMRPGNGNQVSVQIGDIAGAIIRGNAATRAAARGDAPVAVTPPPGPMSGTTAAIGHISFGIENWDTERVRAELKKRDVVYVNKEGQREPRPDMTGTLESFHVPDAMGWDLQIGNKISPTR